MSRTAVSERRIRPELICRRLRRAYGPVKLGRRLDPLSELILTILSQNTSDRNSGPAFRALRRRFPDWEAARRAPVSAIEAAIRPAGLAPQKAPRIRAILQLVRQRHGRLSLEFLRELPTDQAWEYLSGLPGVGPKTAACVLLFACGKPVLPVDTHVHRVSCRLGLLAGTTTAAKAHELLGQMVPDRLVLEFHVQLIRLGRTVCVARNPRCGQCVLHDVCPDARRRAVGRDGRRSPTAGREAS